MDVIPVINCPDIACAKERLARLAEFYPRDGWVHLDVTDGNFSTHRTWADPSEWAALEEPFALEVHLMVRRPEEFVGPWLAAGAKRIVVHIESLTRESAQAIAETIRKHGASLMLAENPETSVEDFGDYGDLCSAFQILAVRPGPAGQELMPGIFEKISRLRQLAPNAIIEVDGGINPKTAEQAKAAGASVVASGAYIFEAEDPKAAYESLEKI